MGYHQKIINLLKERGRLDSKSIINILKTTAEKNPTATIYRHLNELVANHEIYKMDYWSNGLRVTFENEKKEELEDEKESIGNRLYKYTLSDEDDFEIEDYAIGNKLVKSGNGFLKINDQKIADESICFNLTTEKPIEHSKQVILLINKRFVRINLYKRTEIDNIWPIKIIFGRVDRKENLESEYYTDKGNIIIGINDQRISSFKKDGRCHFSIKLNNETNIEIKDENSKNGIFLIKNITTIEQEIILRHFSYFNHTFTGPKKNIDDFYQIRKSANRLTSEVSFEGNAYLCCKMSNDDNEELFMECLII